MTVAELVKSYLAWAHEYYRKPSGRPTRHHRNLRSALKGLDFCCRRKASGFSRRDLEHYRALLIDRGVSRGVVNQWTRWVRAMFRWAARRGKVPPHVVSRLDLVRAVAYARSRAPELPRVRSVDHRQVSRVLDVLPPTAATAVRLQWLTGMRSSEVLSMRWEDIEKVGSIWLYRPREHKTEHHGHSRVVLLCPHAQRVIGMHSRTGWILANRLGKPYAPNSYSQAVRRACDVANVHPWTPHQLRHSAATDIARRLGLDAARAFLGHRSIAMTEHYVDREETEILELVKQLRRVGWRKPL